MTLWTLFQFYEIGLKTDLESLSPHRCSLRLRYPRVASSEDVGLPHCVLVAGAAQFRPSLLGFSSQSLNMVGII